MVAPRRRSKAHPAARHYDAAMSESRPLTLMTVHAHPDDETIGTGGTMARAVADGHRVVLVTCTRGELGEIVVPDMDTPDNHRRLGEIRADELARAMGILGVTEWENLGYRDSGMMGTAGNHDPRAFWQADVDEAVGRLVWLIRRYRPDVVTTYNSFGGYGHPDHIRTHDVAVGAFERAGDPSAYPGQLAPEHGGTGPAETDGGLAPWAPAKLYEQAMSRSLRMAMNEALAEMGRRSFWMPPEDATPEQLAEFNEWLEKLLVPDESITTRVDVGPHVETKWNAIREHVTQISPDSPFMLFGLDGWQRWWSSETYILRESRVEAPTPETDLFAGLG
jgi:N-acetyl-1-D-myo-inositol-2-amino-2-deoxy-alpha-D-glucopyranoside deacetylase